MTGSESAHVVAAHIPVLLRRIAPAARLSAASPGNFGSLGATDGYIVMLPPDAQLARSAWRRFKRTAISQVPILPVVVGDANSSERTFGSRTNANRDARVLKHAGANCTMTGVRALPVIHVNRGDARIEHGGRLYLDPGAADSLQIRLAELTIVSRSGFEYQERPASHQESCRLREATS